jgi:hypothetical protein
VRRSFHSKRCLFHSHLEEESEQLGLVLEHWVRRKCHSKKCLFHSRLEEEQVEQLEQLGLGL